MQNLSLKLPPEIVSEIDKIAAEKKMKRHALIKKIVVDFLGAQDQKKPRGEKIQEEILAYTRMIAFGIVSQIQYTKSILPAVETIRRQMKVAELPKDEEHTLLSKILAETIESARKTFLEYVADELKQIEQEG